MKVSQTYLGYKRVLVTGGAGFLGSHLCERLIAQGHEVFCLDNFHTGTRENIEHLLRKPKFHLIHHDIVLPYYLHVDEIYNLACPASPVHYAFDPVHTIKTSVSGVLNLLGLAKRTGARILHASTSEVYGDPLEHPQTETYWGNVNSYGPRACYDEGKRCAEALLYAYREQHAVDTRICRIFNTYGPRMHQNDGRVVSNFVVQALRGHAITIYGDGSQTRSFCYVDDLIEGMITLMNSSEDVTHPVNLGNPEEYTVLQLAQEVCDLTGLPTELVFKPLPQDDPTRRRPDISVARESLGWYPKTKLREGLRRTIEYFDAALTVSGQKPAASVSHLFSPGIALNAVGSAR
jgi:UDP-glucuronate decarboxylase